MKKLLFLILTLFILVSCSGTKNIEESKSTVEESKMVGLANPWTDCGTNFNQATQIAGFTFPLKLSNCDVRAMKNMIEINYPLDQTRTVCVRKTATNEFSNNGDISGVYTEYPVNEKIMLKDSVPIYTRGTGDKIYVMNMAASNGYYSAYCKDGMSLQEIEQIYETIAEAETSALYSQDQQ
ncbi:MAG: hypothetical protein IKN42_06490 [Elusimicrobia bacterium]|nr:hypothetical protein [Elusimicrobiota bacterium]